ncbi:MAG: hypothetical protein DLM70_06170 [Chloroflexi bacterium]|nr:MAG: hypothetical protein DLM70_06170 [Chloroflexota bacterium]
MHLTGLIHLKRPEATQVAGYRRWSELGRQVKKGERGIKILVPYIDWTNKDKAEERDEENRNQQSVVRGFGVGTVFDVLSRDSGAG